MKKRIYISGAITGRNMDEVLEQFEKAENYFKDLGFEVANPAKVGTHELSWFDNMTVALGMLRGCNHIYVLPNSESSAGVAVERIYAKQLNVKEIHIL